VDGVPEFGRREKRYGLYWAGCLGFGDFMEAVPGAGFKRGGGAEDFVCWTIGGTIRAEAAGRNKWLPLKWGEIGHIANCVPFKLGLWVASSTRNEEY